MNHGALKAMLLQHEALRLKPYHDTVGKLTIGVGRNLDDVGISRLEAMIMLGQDVIRVEKELQTALPWFDNLDENLQLVFADMCFNLGLNRFLGFKNMLAAAQRGDRPGVIREMRNSKWARQVGHRVDQLVAMLH